MIIFTSRGKNFSEFPFRNFWPWNWRGCFVKIFNWEYKINKFIFFLKGQSELKAFQFLKHKTLLPRLQSFSQGRGQIFLWCRKEDGSFGQDEECWLKWTRKSLKKIRLKEWWGGYWHPWNQLGTSQNPLCDNTQVFKWKERGDTGSLDFPSTLTNLFIRIIFTSVPVKPYEGKALTKFVRTSGGTRYLKKAKKTRGVNGNKERGITHTPLSLASIQCFSNHKNIFFCAKLEKKKFNTKKVFLCFTK